MFDHDNTAVIWRGAAVRHAAVADQNAASARTFADAMRHNFAVAEDAKADLQRARVRIAELEDALAVERAHSAGFEAQVAAYRDQHPDSPLRRDSGCRYRDGDIKRQIRLVYETAFDATLRKLLPQVDPVARRAD